MASAIKEGRTKYGSVAAVALAGTIDEECRRLLKTSKRGSGEYAKRVAAELKGNYPNYGLQYWTHTEGRTTFKFFGTSESLKELQFAKPWEMRDEDA